MFEGVLVGESLRAGAELSGVPLSVNRVRRVAGAGATDAQPADWTLIDFTVPDSAAPALAAALARCLSADGGWYADFRSDQEVYVVLADRVCRYRRGDAAGRERARAYARSAGVPETQLDWAE
ncbi:hypothetical protein [Streptomyces sp. VRA16 Mangrove soil]|uniref:hypothetical protein n=1 Tax=Streptomyces sp. VRA16 Mangrove soil TaxID=2817434 RepID=UPI001A9FA4B7|nr:hypothetical protein [Streptomyces sp. VRA16 Mangrove soil]MBO1334446.1 hypothetical protein [Streptomyces sp. VRA16 Mangrove soil]